MEAAEGEDRLNIANLSVDSSLAEGETLQDIPCAVGLKTSSSLCLNGSIFGTPLIDRTTVNIEPLIILKLLFFWL
jgi:hypothetical protein